MSETGRPELPGGSSEQTHVAGATGASGGLFGRGWSSAGWCSSCGSHVRVGHFLGCAFHFAARFGVEAPVTCPHGLRLAWPPRFGCARCHAELDASFREIFGEPTP